MKDALLAADVVYRVIVLENVLKLGLVLLQVSPLQKEFECYYDFWIIVFFIIGGLFL